MTKIFFNEGLLSFSGLVLATKEQYELADKCVGSVFESLADGEVITLQEGDFHLDKDLDIEVVRYHD